MALMCRKLAFFASLIFLFICDSCFSSDAVATKVYVNPSLAVVSAVGESLCLNVSITGVTDLYGWQFTLYYNNTLLNCTEVSEGSFLRSNDETFMVAHIENNHNSTHGQLQAYCFLLTGPGGTGVNGTGLLAALNFTAKVEGGPYVLNLCNTILSNSNGEPIPHQTVDGAVTVIPEFPSMFLILLLIVVISVVSCVLHAMDK